MQWEVGGKEWVGEGISGHVVGGSSDFRRAECLHEALGAPDESGVAIPLWGRGATLCSPELGST